MHTASPHPLSFCFYLSVSLSLTLCFGLSSLSPPALLHLSFLSDLLLPFQLYNSVLHIRLPLLGLQGLAHPECYAALIPARKHHQHNTFVSLLALLSYYYYIFLLPANFISTTHVSVCRHWASVILLLLLLLLLWNLEFYIYMARFVRPVSPPLPLYTSLNTMSTTRH